MPSIAVSRFYEAIYILDADLGEEQITATSARYKQIVETAGGTVEKVDIWERRRLAYPVKTRTEGIYVVMQFRGFPSVEVELRRVFQISEDHLRYMIVKPEELESPLPLIIQDVAPAAEASIAPVEAIEAMDSPLEDEAAVEAEEPEAVAAE